MEYIDVYSHRLEKSIEKGIDWIEREWKRRHPKTLEEISLDDAVSGYVNPEIIVGIHSMKTGVRFNPNENTLICPKCNAETPLVLDPPKEVYCKCGEILTPKYRPERAKLEFSCQRIIERYKRDEAYRREMSSGSL